MKHRKLRIAWSVAWGIVAVLLIALWVHSLKWRDEAIGVLAGGAMDVISTNGGASIFWMPAPQLYSSWTFTSTTTSRTDVYEPMMNEWKFEHDFTNPYDRNVRVSFPYWFPTLVFGTLAAVPWIRWSRRFSLRTLLIATTLIAVMLGLIAWLR